MITLSPAQALLILIEKYRDNAPMFERLSQLYFLGVNPPTKINEHEDLIEKENDYSKDEDIDEEDSLIIHEPGEGESKVDSYFSDLWQEEHRPYFLGDKVLGLENKREIKKLFSDPALEGYYIDFSPKSINEDPSRRFFETHLAYEIIKSLIKKIKLTDLQLHEQAFSGIEGMTRSIPAIANILSGKFGRSDVKILEEYASYISKLNNAELFQDFSNHERMAILYFVKYACLGVFSTTFNMMLPLDIYKTGIFTEDAKGKIEKRGQKLTRSDFHMGILKSTMPVPREDIAYTESKLPYLKASDKSTYMEETEWTKDNFDRLVHPFSNSISGTVLAQLRNMLVFKENNSSPFLQSAENLKLYFALFNAILLYGTGGHSLHEYSVVLSLPEVQEAFNDIPGFDAINLKSLFYTGNEAAFNKALNDAVDYNNLILKRVNVRESLGKTKAHLQINREAFKALEGRDATLQIINTINVIQEKLKSSPSIFSSYSIKSKKLFNKKIEEIKPFLIKGDVISARSSLEELSEIANTRMGKGVAFNYGNHNPLAKMLGSLTERLAQLPIMERHQGSAELK